ncbi:MAG: hypothetical protein KatS3mg124_1348 [Porticoccaceae bacterium]|nr:MAG: hypothetical protein KatS3mg124_1348 [Porticoccaceae bacterium]
MQQKRVGFARWRRAGLAVALALAAGQWVAAETVPPSPSVQERVEAQARAQEAQRRQALDQAAVEAVALLEEGLRLLGRRELPTAATALQRAESRLSELARRRPDLLRAPVDLDVVVRDLIADPATVRSTVREAVALLERSQVLRARRLLADLGSEVEFRTTYLPVAPALAAVRRAREALEAGEVDEAVAAIQRTLDGRVVVEEVVALPLLRARELLADARRLAARAPLDEADRRRLEELLAEVRKQIELAEVLGYGPEASFAELRRALHELPARGESRRAGWLERIERLLGELVPQR